MRRLGRAVRALRDQARAARGRLLLISDGARWALDGVAFGIAGHLPASLEAQVLQSVPMWVGGRTIHFIDRNAALEGDRVERLHRRNRVIVTWSHGGATSFEHPDLVDAARDLERVAPFVDRVQVWTSLYIPVVARLGIDPANVVTVPLGIDLDAFRDVPSQTEARERLGVPGSAICIGSFQRDGDVTPKLVKGPDILADLAEGLHRRSPRSVVLLSGPARGWIRTELARRGVPFIYVGVVPARERATLYRACDLYVVTAREEGGPLGLLEAMASGIPVLTTDVGIAHDLIEPDRNGARVAIADAEALQREAFQLIDDRGLAARLAAQAASDVRAYDWRELAPRYVRELYRA